MGLWGEICHHVAYYGVGHLMDIALVIQVTSDEIRSRLFVRAERWYQGLCHVGASTVVRTGESQEVNHILRIPTVD